MKVTILTILITFFSATLSESEQEFSIIGKWEDKEMQVEYEFAENNHVYFSQMGYGIQATYKINKDKSPNWIDFTMKRGNNSLEIPGLLKIKNNDTIWIEQDAPRLTHLTNFSKDSTSRARKIHILTRVK